MEAETAAHTAHLFEEHGGWTADCAGTETTTCDWLSSRAVPRWAAQQEADLHMATTGNRTWPCPASDTHVEAEHEGGVIAACPYCGLTVDVRPSYVSRRNWRYGSHVLILDGDDAAENGLSEADLADWWETTRAAVEGGQAAVRRLNEQARIRAMSSKYRQQRGKAS